MSTATKEKKNVAKGFQPLGERVFVTYTEELEKTAGGFMCLIRRRKSLSEAWSKLSARRWRTSRSVIRSYSTNIQAASFASKMKSA